ncbi:MAG: 5-oxoprolinase subunit PxpA [Pseudomonadota bacterium]
MPTEKTINLNADLGESFGPWVMGDDDALLDVVTSANLACGFHAGDPDVMRRTVRACVAKGVSIGAHPGYHDLQGFGRRALKLTHGEIENLIAYQVGALAAIAALEGGKLTHVKPHGALNNQACADVGIAAAICRAVRGVDPDLILLAPAASALLTAGRDTGLRVVEEIFADRAYQNDGQLAPRGTPGAMVHGAENCAAHVQAMLAAGALITLSGKRIPTAIGSVCVHGDGAEAVAVARHLRRALEQGGWNVVPLPAL